MTKQLIKIAAVSTECDPLKSAPSTVEYFQIGQSLWYVRRVSRIRILAYKKRTERRMNHTVYPEYEHDFQLWVGLYIGMSEPYNN